MRLPAWVLGVLLCNRMIALGSEPVAPLHGDFEDAELHEWVQPVYPEAAKSAKLEGKVMVEFVVEVDGHVSHAAVQASSDERFNASALAAVSRWVFYPAYAEGKPTASGMQVPVEFKLEQLRQKGGASTPPPGLRPVAPPVVPPQLGVAPDPDYPAELRERMLSGRVELEFNVEADGTPSAPKVLWSSHAAFVGEALRALEKYRFTPAHQGLVPQRSGRTEGQMEFGIQGVDRTGILAANRITVLEPERFREPPAPAVMPEPVYPRELLLAAEAGSASVEFSVTTDGGVAAIRLREASRPAFGAALEAAVGAWRFEPAHFVQEAGLAQLVVNYKFAPPTGGPVHRLLQALQPGGTGLSGAGGLDQKLRPVWRVAPAYPLALADEKPSGQAVIEFIIDQDGRARLPRVASATREEFGWAAATAVGQWVFAPPRRGGQPVDVKVSVPFEFAPPGN